MKIFYSLAAIFVVIISTGLVIAAWPTMPIMGVIAIGIALVLATGAGLIGLYWLWARAERERAGGRRYPAGGRKSPWR